jgi:hypothetical protein
MIDNIASITSRQSTPAVDAFSLQRRNPEGGTKRLTYWGFDNETDPLTDVLLAAPEHLRHMATSSLSRKFLRESPSNIEVAKAQHRELTAAYQQFGVRIHAPILEPELPMQVYTRDSSVMTPFGAVITAMANWWRRGENYAAIRNYERLEFRFMTWSPPAPSKAATSMSSRRAACSSAAAAAAPRRRGRGRWKAGSSGKAGKHAWRSSTNTMCTSISWWCPSPSAHRGMPRVHRACLGGVAPRQGT